MKLSAPKIVVEHVFVETVGLTLSRPDSKTYQYFDVAGCYFLLLNSLAVS